MFIGREMLTSLVVARQSAAILLMTGDVKVRNNKELMEDCVACAVLQNPEFTQDAVTYTKVSESMYPGVADAMYHNGEFVYAHVPQSVYAASAPNIYEMCRYRVALTNLGAGDVKATYSNTLTYPEPFLLKAIIGNLGTSYTYSTLGGTAYRVSADVLATAGDTVMEASEYVIEGTGNPLNTRYYTQLYADRKIVPPARPVTHALFVANFAGTSLKDGIRMDTQLLLDPTEYKHDPIPTDGYAKALNIRNVRILF